MGGRDADKPEPHEEIMDVPDPTPWILLVLLLSVFFLLRRAKEGHVLVGSLMNRGRKEPTMSNRTEGQTVRRCQSAIEHQGARVRTRGWQAVVIVLRVMGWPTSAVAQHCLGRLAFSDQPTQMQLGGVFGSDTQQFAVGVAGGSTGFGGVAAIFANQDDQPDASFDTALGVEGFGGGEVHAGRVAICPIGGGGYFFGPNIHTVNGTIDVRSIAAGAGAAVGVTAVDSDVVQVIPTVRLGFQYQRDTLTVGDNSRTIDDTVGLVQFGVGVVFSEIVSVTPLVRVPFGADGADAEFVLLASIGFR